MAALAVAALAVRVAVVVQLHDHPLLQPVGRLDSGVAFELAGRVAGGDLLLRGGTGGQPFYFAPLYVYFLAAVLAAGGSLLAVLLAQALLGTAAVLLLWRAARPWFGERAALAGGWLLALSGPVVFHEAVVLHAALDPFLMALALAAVTRATPATADAGAGDRTGLAAPGSGRARRGAAGLLAGAAVGLFALNRPNALAWGVALAALAPLLAPRGARRRALARAAGVLVGLVLAVAPATLRNLAVSGEPVVISSHGGLNLYLGNNALADGTYRTVPGITPDLRGQAEDARRLASRQQGRALGARETDAHFRALAWRWIHEHPAQAAALFLRKLAYLLGATELALNHAYAYYAREEPTLLRWLPAGAWLLVPLGLAGLVDRARAGWTAPGGDGPPRRAYLAWALAVPAYGLSVAAFFVSSRYRLPLLVPLAAGAGFALVRLAGLARRREGRRLARYGLALGALATLALWPHGLDDGRSEERTAMVLWLLDNGRTREALGRLAEADADRTSPEARLALVRALASAGEGEQAAAQLQRLLPPAADAAGPAVAPTDPVELLAIGSLGLELKRPDLALLFFDRGLARDPRLAALREKRGLALLMLGREQEARAELEQARALDPASASACLNLAVLEAQQGRRDAARELASEALRLRPGYAQAHGLLEALDRR